MHHKRLIWQVAHSDTLNITTLWVLPKLVRPNREARRVQDVAIGGGWRLDHIVRDHSARSYFDLEADLGLQLNQLLRQV